MSREKTIKVKPKWKEGTCNHSLAGKGFHISYNPNTDSGELLDLGNLLGRFVGRSFEDGEETALCYSKKFYILVGDYRKEYEKVFPKGKTACKKLFDSLVKDGAEVSTWSN